MESLEFGEGIGVDIGMVGRQLLSEGVGTGRVRCQTSQEVRWRGWTWRVVSLFKRVGGRRRALPEEGGSSHAQGGGERTYVAFVFKVSCLTDRERYVRSDLPPSTAGYSKPVMDHNPRIRRMWYLVRDTTREIGSSWAWALFHCSKRARFSRS